MKTFEYATQDHETTHKLVDRLNEQGSLGWQLVAVREMARQVSGQQQAVEWQSYLRLVFMREKP